MKTEISRNTFRREKHYSAVRLKQGRLLTDADWNEQADVQNYHRRTKLRDTYGASGAPIDGGGFAITASAADLTIAAGRLYVDGILCENFADTTYTTQKDLPGQASPGDGLYLVYLDAWERGVTGIESNLREAALAGPDTATRAQLLTQIKLVRIGDGSVDVSRFDLPSEYVQIIDAQRGRLRARTRASDTLEDPCEIGERGGYASQENRLYRVEIHASGGAQGGPESAIATFKWSRENATVATELLDLEGTSLTVRSVGRDRAIAFRVGDWIEIVDEGRELAGEPGTFARIEEVVGETLIIDPDTLKHFDGSEGDARELSLADFSRGVVRVRRWDMPDAAGPVTVPAPGTWIEIENGIEILFEADAYRTGDYWLIPARAARRDIEWPRDNFGAPLAQAAGPEHRYASLAYVRSLGGIWDVRADLRVELAGFTRGELAYVGGDGQQGMPGETLAEPLRVRVAAGPEVITGARIRFEITHGAGVFLDGPGGTELTSPVILTTDANGLAGITLRLDASTNQQRVEAVLLDPQDNSATPYVVRFTANLNFAAAVHYAATFPGPGGENLMQGVSAVDQALDRLGEMKVNRSGDTITGSLDIHGDLNVFGDLTVRGDVIVQNSNNIHNSVLLGNHDTDRIILHAELDSGHSSGRLVVDDTVHARGDVDVDGRIGVGTNSPTYKLSAVGIIEALDGGLVFPDGTVQTRAGTGGGGDVPLNSYISGENTFAPANFTYVARNLSAGGNYATWTTRASMTFVREKPAVAVLRGRIYVAGGSRGGAGASGRTENEEYDPLSNSWRSRAALPVGTGHLTAVAYDDRMFVFGGSTWSGASLTGVTSASRQYDPIKNLWTDLTAMPTARAAASAALVDETIYVIGGDTNPSNGVPLATNEAYDPRTNTWSARAPMPTARTNAAAAVVHGKIYVFGGNPVSSTGLNSAEVYDPATNQWASLNPMPFSGYGMIAVVVDSRIHVIGGIHLGSDLNIYKIYNPVDDSWSDGPAGMSLRHGAGGAVFENTIYYLAGQVQGPTGDVAINEAISPAVYFPIHCKIETTLPMAAVLPINFKIHTTLPMAAVLPFYLDWTARSSVPIPRTGMAAGAIKDRIYLTGGHDDANVHTDDLYEYEPATDVWTAKAGMPTVRAYAAYAVYADRLYVIGGNTGGNEFAVNEAYDPATDSWATLASAITARFYAAAATGANGKIYVFGGTRNNSENLNITEEYDPQNNVWATRQAMPAASRMPAAVTAGDRIYVIGGINNPTYLNVNQMYDPVANTWSLRQAMPTARYGASAVYIGGEIYVMGGNANGVNSNIVEIYNPETDTWRAGEPLLTARVYLRSTLVQRTIYSMSGGSADPAARIANEAKTIPATTTRAALPAPRASHSMAALGSKLYLTGGYGTSSSVFRTETFEYDPAINAWSSKAPMPTARYEAVSAVANNRMYVIGGGAGPTGETPLAANEAYDAAANAWTVHTAMPTPRRDAAVASDGVRIFVTGGYDNATLALLEIYDADSNSWSSGASMPTARTGHVAVFLNGLLYAIGGSLSSNALTGLTEVYDPQANSWTTRTAMPTPRDNAAIVARNGRIYVIGGRTLVSPMTLSRIVEEYNPATNTWRRMPDLPLARAYFSAALIDDRIFIAGGNDSTPQAIDSNQLIVFKN